MRILWTYCKKKFFASTLLSIKSAIFKIFPIRQKYWILWGKPVPTPCFALKSDDFWQNATFLADFRFLAQKGPPVKKLKNQASLYLMNFDYLSYESNLLILGHPHICERGGDPKPLHCIPSIGVCIYIDRKMIAKSHLRRDQGHWDLKEKGVGIKIKLLNLNLFFKSIFYTFLSYILDAMPPLNLSSRWLQIALLS